MSAFKVSDRHIRILAHAACSAKYFSYVWRGKVRTLDLTQRDRVCSLLATENDRSLMARYPKDFETLGGRRKATKMVFLANGLHQEEPENLTDTYGTIIGFRLERDYSTAEIYQAIRCYVYQACEHDAWQLSEAYAICHALSEHYGKILATTSGVLDKVDWTY